MLEIDKKILGNKIKEIRVNKRMTLEAFANAVREKTGNAQRTGKSLVSKWERGENIPNDITLKAIADLAGISVDDLLGNNEYLNGKDDLLLILDRDLGFAKARLKSLEDKVNNGTTDDLSKADNLTFIHYTKKTIDYLTNCIENIINDKGFELYFYNSSGEFIAYILNPHCIYDLTVDDIHIENESVPWNQALIYSATDNNNSKAIDINNKLDILDVIKSNYDVNTEISFGYLDDDLEWHSYNEDFWHQLNESDQIIY